MEYFSLRLEYVVQVSKELLIKLIGTTTPLSLLGTAQYTHVLAKRMGQCPELNHGLLSMIGPEKKWTKSTARVFRL